MANDNQYGFFRDIQLTNGALNVSIAGGEGINSSSSGIEFTGGFAGKPLTNNYAWQPGVGIEIDSADVAAKIYKTFSLDRAVHLVTDVPYWTVPTPADHTD